MDDIADIELARLHRGTAGDLVLLLSRRGLDNGAVRTWLTLSFARTAGSVRHFTVGVHELDALEQAIREVRKAAQGARR